MRLRDYPRERPRHLSRGYGYPSDHFSAPTHFQCSNVHAISIRFLRPHLGRSWRLCTITTRSMFHILCQSSMAMAGVSNLSYSLYLSYATLPLCYTIFVISFQFCSGGYIFALRARVLRNRYTPRRRNLLRLGLYFTVVECFSFFFSL